MRVSPLATMVSLASLALVASACSSSGGSTGSNAGATTGTSRGTTGGVMLLGPGQHCTTNQACDSGVCGIEGSGNCCAQPCSNTDPVCGANACDATGACSYPNSAIICPTTCPLPEADADGGIDAGAILYTNSCNGDGGCVPVSSAICPANFGCDTGGSCNTTCSSSAECAPGFACNNRLCVPVIATGACSENDDCASKHCGVGGFGFCCAAACPSIDAPCGAVDCDPDGGACIYPNDQTTCGTVKQSCTGSTQNDATHCDGLGNCATPAPISCGNYACGNNAACLTSCGLDGGCATGAFCEISGSVCCGGLADGGSIAVDSVNGNDNLACCGLGGATPCQTITHAMSLIDTAQAPNVTITATVKGVGGDWTPAGAETYPILLGWGARLSAAGVYFSDPSGAGIVFSIGRVSGYDHVGYASIAGMKANPVWIGMTEEGQQSIDNVIIQVQASNTLYIAEANVNGSAAHSSTAINITAGGGLVLGQDQEGQITGTVTIGSQTQSGSKGIVCGSGKNLGCTITDAALVGTSSVVIEGQGSVDIDAEDYAAITLNSAPVIGVPPQKPGFTMCSAKRDVQAVKMNGKASVTFNNGTVQCIGGDGFLLEASVNGNPTLVMNGTTIQNTATAVYATAGTATISTSTIQYNGSGVEQALSGMNSATVDLSSGGGDAGTNTIICSNSIEGGQSPGVSVLNATGQILNASNVTWDTSGPDVFKCNGALGSCVCASTSCTDSPGANGMDAVYIATGAIDTTGNLLAGVNCAP